MHYGQGSAIPLLAQSAVLLDDKLQAQIHGLDHNALENHEKISSEQIIINALSNHTQVILLSLCKHLLLTFVLNHKFGKGIPGITHS